MPDQYVDTLWKAAITVHWALALSHISRMVSKWPDSEGKSQVLVKLGKMITECNNEAATMVAGLCYPDRSFDEVTHLISGRNVKR